MRSHTHPYDWPRSKPKATASGEILFDDAHKGVLWPSTREMQVETARRQIRRDIRLRKGRLCCLWVNSNGDMMWLAQSGRIQCPSLFFYVIDNVGSGVE